MDEQERVTMSQAPALPEDISRSMLTSAVCHAAQLTQIEALSWEWERIYEPLVSTTKDVYRLTGSAQQCERELPWSLILKVLAPRADQQLPLEAYLYRSGFLASLSDGLIAPQCYGIDNLPDGSIALWLEFVHDNIASGWRVEQFARAAQHLGSFNAQHPPSDPLLPPRRVPYFTWYDLIDLWRE